MHYISDNRSASKIACENPAPITYNRLHGKNSFMKKDMLCDVVNTKAILGRQMWRHSLSPRWAIVQKIKPEQK